MTTSDPILLHARSLVPGEAAAEVVYTNETLSFWGGINPETGEIIDRRHERSGCCVVGRVFAFPSGRGSSTASAILLECIRRGTAPAAIINSSVDEAIVLGAIVADELYGKSIPIVLVSQEDFAKLDEADRIEIHAGGRICVYKGASSSE